MDRTCKCIEGVESKSAIEIRIRRSTPSSKECSKESVYHFDYSEGMTLHRALEQIYKMLDPTLAFRRYRCNKGICMGCLVSVNGKRRKACSTFLKPGDRLLIEADPTHALVRDLVTVL